MRFYRFISIAVIALIVSSTSSAEEQANFHLKDCSVNRRATCFASDNHPQYPFQMLQPNQTKAKTVALLIHGLSDSPYYMKDIANDLYEEGLNVVAIRLSGHGTKPEDLLHAKLAEWQKDVANGLKIAGQFGERVILVGLSTGGALAIQAALANKNVSGLILFSPALAIASPLAAITCIPGIESSLFGGPWVKDRGEEENLIVQYKKIARTAVCQLYHLTWQIVTRYKQIRIPTLSVITEYESLIRPEVSLQFMKENSAAYKRTVFYAKNPSQFDYLRTDRKILFLPTAKIAHGEVSIRDNMFDKTESNPLYSVVNAEVKKLLQYLRENVPN